MKLRVLIYLAALLLPLFGHTQEGNGQCRADVDKFCRGSQSDPKAATDCLLDHQQEISDACYDNLKQRLRNQSGQGEDGGPGGKACKQDAQSLCKGIQPGGGRIVNCLKDHQNELSDACYEQLSKRARRNRN